MKKKCWHILGIKPTSDLRIIRKAWLELIKIHHPDTVHTPEQKRKFTILCAEINNAYEDAQRIAPFVEYKSDEGINPCITYEAQNSWSSKSISIFMKLLVVSVMFILLSSLSFFIYKNIPEGFLSIPTIFVIIFRGLLLAALYLIYLTIVGIFVIGIIDWMIFEFLLRLPFISYILRKHRLEKYELKLTWFLIVLTNMSIVYFSDLTEINKVIIFSSLDNLRYPISVFLSLSAACLVPVWFAADWVNDFIKYIKLKKKGSVTSIPPLPR